METDILQEIPDEDLPLLRNLYKDHRETAPQVASLLNHSIAWKKKKPDAKYLTFYGVDNNWLESGTFILLMQYSCNDLFVFTLEEDGKSLYEGLTKTKRIDWTKRMLWYAVASRHIPIVQKALKQLNPSYNSSENAVETGLWVLDREKALKFEIECPNDLYIDQVNTSHAELIASEWPHNYKGAKDYLATYIEMSNSCGLFLKSDGSLVSWILKSPMGQLAILQTVPQHKRKGYGSIMIKALAKEVAQDGYHPAATIVTGNVASETMFGRLGFRNIDICTFFIYQ